MTNPKLVVALADCAGSCWICKMEIVGERGYTEFWEYKGKKYHKECLGGTLRDISADNDERPPGKN
jgi:hypothetical protein